MSLRGDWEGTQAPVVDITQSLLPRGVQKATMRRVQQVQHRQVQLAHPSARQQQQQQVQVQLGLQAVEQQLQEQQEQ